MQQGSGVRCWDMHAGARMEFLKALLPDRVDWRVWQAEKLHMDE